MKEKLLKIKRKVFTIFVKTISSKLFNIVFVIPFLALVIIKLATYTPQIKNDTFAKYAVLHGDSSQNKQTLIVNKYNDFINTTKVVFQYKNEAIVSSKSFIEFDLDNTLNMFDEGKRNSFLYKVNSDVIKEEVIKDFPILQEATIKEKEIQNYIETLLEQNISVILVKLEDFIDEMPKEEMVTLKSTKITVLDAEKFINAIGEEIVFKPLERFNLNKYVINKAIYSDDLSNLATAICILTTPFEFESYVRNDSFFNYEEVPYTIRPYKTYTSNSNDIDFSLFNSSKEEYVIQLKQIAEKEILVELRTVVSNVSDEYTTKVVTIAKTIEVEDYFEDFRKEIIKEKYGEKDEENLESKEAEASNNEENKEENKIEYKNVHNGLIIDVYRHYIDKNGKLVDRKYLYTNYYKPTREIVEKVEESDKDAK